MVVSQIPTAITFHDFLEKYGEDARIELIDGELFELEPKGPHEEVVAFIDRKLNVQIDLLDLNYFVLQRGLLKPSGDCTAFRPDILVVDRDNLINEPLWEKQSVITSGQSIKLIAEVVSSNWQNDYARKMEDYAKSGIPKYWIVDYAGLGGERFIGKPKASTATICNLINENYKDKALKAKDDIHSLIFPGMKLTLKTILNSLS